MGSIIQSDLVKHYGFPKMQEKLRLGKKELTLAGAVAQLPYDAIHDPVCRHWFFCKSSLGRQWLAMLEKYRRQEERKNGGH